MITNGDDFFYHAKFVVLMCNCVAKNFCKVWEGNQHAWYHKVELEE